jgi:hypothetical protein
MQSSTLLVPSQGKINSVHIIAPYFLEILFNIVALMPRSSEWYLHLRLSKCNFVSIYHLSCLLHVQAIYEGDSKCKVPYFIPAERTPAFSRQALVQIAVIVTTSGDVIRHRSSFNMTTVMKEWAKEEVCSAIRFHGQKISTC